VRDIISYQNLYEDEPFEATQVRYRRKKVLELLNKNTHKRILEVGCGLEPLYRYCDGYEKMVIIEPSPSFCEHAKEGIPERVVCLQGFLEDSIEEIKKEEPFFDYIVVSSLLHEVENPARLLTAVKLLCGENTVVHINVPNARSFHRLLALEMGLIKDVYQRSEQQVLMQRHSVYDMSSLKLAVGQAGFKVIESGSYFIKPLTHRQMQAMLDQEIINSNILDGLYRMEKYFPEYGSEIFVQIQIK